MIWRTADLLTKTKAELEKGFVRAGLHFVSSLRVALNVDQPYRRSKRTGRYRGLSPSAPGQYPRKLSGQLMRSITYQFDKSKMELTVGSNLVGYPSFLQSGTRFMQARPFLSLSWASEQSTIGKLILGK